MSAWHALSSNALTGAALTLAAFEGGVRLQRRFGGHVLANPVLLSIIAIAAFLRATGISYADYMAGAGVILFCLGPATVALALPLRTHAEQMRGFGARLAIAVGLGATAAAASAVAIVWLLGAPGVIMQSIAPKSVTTAIAIGVSAQIGGIPALTASMVIFTGIGGAMAGTLVLEAFGIRDRRARGLAIGVAAHGIGTAYALAHDETEGAYAGLGMTLAGVFTGLLLPAIWKALA